MIDTDPNYHQCNRSMAISCGSLRSLLRVCVLPWRRGVDSKVCSAHDCREASRSTHLGCTYDPHPWRILTFTACAHVMHRRAHKSALNSAVESPNHVARLPTTNCTFTAPHQSRRFVYCALYNRAVTILVSGPS
jgi:hypothetical protein